MDESNNRFTPQPAQKRARIALMDQHGRDAIELLQRARAALRAARNYNNDARLREEIVLITEAINEWILRL